MPSYLSPGVYIEEVPSAVQSIAGVGTNTIGFIGVVPDTIGCPVYLTDAEYQARLKVAFDKIYSAGMSLTDSAINTKISQLRNAMATPADAPKPAPAPKAKGAAADSPAADGTTTTPPAAAPEATTETITAVASPSTATNMQNLALSDGLTSLLQLPVADRPAAARLLARRLAMASVPRYDVVPVTIDVPIGQAKLCTNFTEFQSRFGDWSAYTPDQVSAADANKITLSGHQVLSHAVFGAFNNGASRIFVARVRGDNNGAPLAADIQVALDNFESIESISIVGIPGSPTAADALVAHCEKTKYRFAILDTQRDPLDSNNKFDPELLTYDDPATTVLPSRSKHAALYFPYIEVVDPALQMQQANLDVIPSKYKGLVYVPPSGAVAGIYARTDDQRGVWKAPANTSVLGARNVQYYIGRAVQDGLNPQGVNCIRTLNGDITVWGARTLGGDLNTEWRYVSVRRTFLYIAKSIDEGTQWCVFEPNDISLWGKVRRNVSAFLTTTWRNGALFGATADEAFYVKCDAENNPPDTREVGQLIVEVGIAIVRPAEFVIFRITQGTAKSA